jgi:hypothetical protein
VTAATMMVAPPAVVQEVGRGTVCGLLQRQNESKGNRVLMFFCHQSRLTRQGREDLESEIFRVFSHARKYPLFKVVFGTPIADEERKIRVGLSRRSGNVRFFLS